MVRSHFLPSTLELGPPTDLDAFAFQELLTTTPFLFNNSLHCNLLQCTHFADTLICAKEANQLVAFIFGYRIPTRPDTLFIWQTIVTEPYRGQGLATHMLQTLLRCPSCQDIVYLEVTIPNSNQAS
ncbi:GNAT family N-acetyltransferase [Leptolyngbya sp. Heron Island J]|uniref:GNAT family N-acetyltransferase n=1 Tax=Leptolyngbya sp. Heron Island J TaxID=1385935 RepID=UPI00041CD5E9|nr:GNAT family N-acetyltransferase [Leptolyngbya sp. Heron Island J]